MAGTQINPQAAQESEGLFKEKWPAVPQGKPQALANGKTMGRVGCAMVTPFLENGELDCDHVKVLAKHLVNQGVDLLVVSGTTGESPTTHQPEKDLLVKLTREAVGEDIFIVAGAGSNDTAHAARMAASARKCGADGLLVVAPYYNRPSQEGLYAHVKAVVEAGEDLPVVLYDIPGRTGLAFSQETIMRLAQLPQVVAMKDATGQVEQGLRRAQASGLDYYSGDDALNYDWLAHGAVGIISVVAHVAAPYYREMIRLIDNGDFVSARELLLYLEPLVSAIMGGGQGAVMTKHALALQGILPHPTLRLPLVPASDEEVGKLAKVLKTFHLL